MAAAYPPSSSSSSSAIPHRAAQHRPQSSTSASNAPQGTFLPGTKVQVGSHRVVIEKYLSEGGFAHVYVVRIPREGSKYDVAVLKRVAVPDKDHLANMRTEVETMKKLKGHKRIVTYIDSHASQLKGGGYEVFLLMEFCQGGGLIDFMNTRLQHRLVEVEILKIFGDVAEGVACMHYLKPPLLHRDLKVENVLISKIGRDGVPVYKLCDFGSTAPPRPAATTAEEGRLIEEDVQKHTTMQYRSPEMIDVWRKRPIDEKADIWALGVLLYKLCYYTTPFEEVGQMAILNASFKYPSYPQFSDKVKKLIGWMLKEDPRHRPNIYQVVEEVCKMRGVEIPIRDIYANRTESEVRRNESLPSPTSNIPSSPPAVGLQKATPQVEVQSVPDIAPMRRGRPTAPVQQAPTSAKPSPSPARGDPFAALDSKNYEVRAGAVDELSKRFPSLDEFSIAQTDKSGPYQFNKASPRASAGSGKDVRNSLNERVTNALADEVFSSVSTKPQVDLPKSQSSTQLKKPGPTPPKPQFPQRSRDVTEKPRNVGASKPIRPQETESGYISTGTGTSPPRHAKPRPAQATQPEIKLPEVSRRPIWRVPSDDDRSSSQPRASDNAQAAAASLQPSVPPTQRPALLQIHRSKSQTATATTELAEPQRNLTGGVTDQETSVPTTQSRSRLSGAFVSSNLNFLRDQESSRKTSSEARRSMDARRHSRQASPRLVAVDDGDEDFVPDDRNIDNNIDFLHSKEEDGVEMKKRHSRKGSYGLGHRKRSSLPSISGATKEIFKGRFGDAFKRFEGSSSAKDDTEKAQALQIDTSGPRTPVPRDEEQENSLLSPIAGSEATPSKHSDDAGSIIGEPEDLPPDVRRELERRRHSQEERRVIDAAKEYRERVTADGTGNAPSAHANRASTIQRRVQSLLDEGQRSTSPVKRTAEGYGRYTDENTNERETQGTEQTALPPRTSSLNKALPPPPQSNVVNGAKKQAVVAALPDQATRAPAYGHSYPRQAAFTTAPAASPASSATAAPTLPPMPSPQRTFSRPSAPPKPKVLRTGQWPPPPPSALPESVTEKALPAQPSGGLAALLAKDLEGVPDYPPRGGGSEAQVSSSVQEGLPDDVEQEFSLRYPSLSGIEMVEREIGGAGGRGRVREV